MSGISRFKIIDPVRGRGGWRFEESERQWPAANAVYREAFECIGLPLASGEEVVECTSEEFEAGYDVDLGIDIIFTFENGTSATCQEKILFTSFRTVTVEFENDWRQGIEGDWFNLRCQYYMVGYAKKRPAPIGLWDWRLCSWPALAALPDSAWRIRYNAQDGARASFKYVGFDSLPSECVVAGYEDL